MSSQISDKAHLKCEMGFVGNQGTVRCTILLWRIGEALDTLTPCINPFVRTKSASKCRFSPPKRSKPVSRPTTGC